MKTPEPHNSVEVFYSYAHEDEKLRDELKKHLSNLKRQGVITDWYDRDIAAGKEWDKEIEKHLNSARVILLLISPDFMDSDYINDVEVERAMEKHERGDACVIPVLLRPVDWEGTPFSKLQAVPTDARPVTAWTNQDEAFVNVAKAIRRALQELPAAEFSVVSLPANVPRPPVVGFVARRDNEGRDVVKRLTEELAPEKKQLIALCGPGGVGKTTLAAEAVRALSEVVGVRIVWIGALGREDFAFSTMLNEIATQLGNSELHRLASGPKAEQVQALLLTSPTLIVLDNFETINNVEQDRCVHFLFDRQSCSALITTRQRIELVHNIAVGAMSREEASEFMARLISESSDPSILREIDQERLLEMSDRNPLVLQWLVAQIDLAQDPELVLDELSQGVGVAAQRVFDRSFNLDQLGDDGRATLLALSLFAPNANREALAEVAGFGADLKRLNEAVKRLKLLGLIRGVDQNKRLTVEGLTHTLAAARLASEKLAAEYRHRFVKYFQKYVQAHGKDLNVDDRLAMDREKDNFLAAFSLGAPIKDCKCVLAMTGHVQDFLENRGYWDEAIKCSEQALVIARCQSDQAALANCVWLLGRMLALQGQHSKARRCFHESLEIYQTLNDERGIAKSLCSLASAIEGNPAEARRLCYESMEIDKKLGDQMGVARCLHLLGSISLQQEDFEDAQKLYEQSLAISSQVNNEGGQAATLNELGRLSWKMKDLARSSDFFEQSYEISERLGDQRLQAFSVGWLGQLASEQGEFAAARVYLEKSFEIRKRLGNKSEANNTLLALAQVDEHEGLAAVKSNQLQEAWTLFTRALEIHEKVEDPTGIARVSANLGLLMERSGYRAEAARLFNRALSIFTEAGLPEAESVRQHLDRVRA